MTLKDMMADDAATVFLNTDEFAETVTYLPRQTGITTTRAPRSISAVVFRESLSGVDENGGEITSPVWIVHVANNASTGITGAELNLGGDRISFPPRDGETAQDRRIVSLQTQDEAMLVLEVR